MWFVFPQIAGLGRSDMAKQYAIAGVAEAQAYHAHRVLGRRLGECCSALLRHPRLTAVAILGEIDATKLRSSMTLFDAVAPDGAYDAVLARYFGARRDPMTIAAIAAQRAR
jgi:uncharacterized protein (DUF1810 family)